MPRRDAPRDRSQDRDAQSLRRRSRASYLPREVFFFGFALPDGVLPSAVARACCFFVAIRPPIRLHPPYSLIGAVAPHCIALPARVRRDHEPIIRGLQTAEGEEELVMNRSIAMLSAYERIDS